MSPLVRQVARFVAIGVLGVGAYLGLFVVLSGVGAQLASVLARLLVAMPTSWLNVRITFGSTVAPWRAYVAGLAGLVLGALLASTTLDVLDLADPGPSRGAEVVALGLAQVVAAVGRFVLLRRVALSGDHQHPHTEIRAPGGTVVPPASDTSRPLLPTGASR